MRNIWKILAVAQIVGFVAFTYWITYRLGRVNGSIQAYEMTQPYIDALKDNITASDTLIYHQRRLIKTQNEVIMMGLHPSFFHYPRKLRNPL